MSTQCPISSTNINTGGPQAGTSGCYCNTNQVWINGSCTNCPTGAFYNASGIQTNLTGCYCLPGQGFDITTNSCITCGSYASNYGQGTPINPSGCYCAGGYGIMNGTCTLCPNNSTYGTGYIATNVTPCYCPTGTGWNLNSCITCPAGSTFTSSTSTNSIGLVGCYCPANYGWHAGACITCPTGSSSQTGGQRTTINYCYCNSGMGWNNIQCATCPVGATSTPTSLMADMLGCYCPTGSGWNNQVCKACSQLNAYQALTGSISTDYLTCYCNTGLGWDVFNDTCSPCPTNSSTGYTGPSTTLIGCYCSSTAYFNWSTLSCITCPTGAVSTTGTLTNVTGCYCPVGTTYSAALTACIVCPTGTNPTGTGGLATTGCYCTSGPNYGWSGTTCVLCSTGLLGTTGVTMTTGCYCPTGQGWNGTTCLTCPINSTNTNTLVNTNLTGCYCITGTQYSSSLNKCINCSSILASSVNNTGIQTPVVGCYCPNGYGYYNNVCTLCSNIGATAGTTGVLTNIDGCVCPTGFGFDGNQCKLCPNGASNNVSPILAIYEGCYCPAGQGLHNGPTSASCMNCPIGSSNASGSNILVANMVGCYCNSGLALAIDSTGNYYCSLLCPTGTSNTGLGGMAQSGCFCNSGTNYGWNGTTCVLCMTNAVGTGVSGPLTNITGCYCSTGFGWNGNSCVACMPNANGMTGTTTTNITGCYCNLGYGWNGTSCTYCPAYAVNTSTPITTNISGCFCPSGWLYSTATSSCVKCSSGTTPSGSGALAGAGCYCSANQGWNDTTCLACPTGASNTYTSVYTNLMGCYCPTGSGWNGVICTGCPVGANNIYNADNLTNVSGCYCPVGTQYSLVYNKCLVCPTGTFSTGQGGGSNVSGCACPIGQGWNGTGCVNCPIFGTNMVTNITTNVSGCYCPVGYQFIAPSNECWICPDGSNTTGTNGGPTPIKGCNCISANSVWTGSRCQVCLGNSSVTNTGATANVSGCFCPSGQIWNTVSSTCSTCASNYLWNGTTCLNCPLGATTTVTSVPISGYTGCYCINGYGWNGTICSLCPQGTTNTGTGGLSVLTGCYCPSGQVWNITGCITCPTNAIITTTPVPTPVTGCYCPSGANYITSTSSCTTCPTGTSTSGVGGLAITGCYCSSGINYGWNGMTCEACPIGSVGGTTGNATNVTGCYCLSGYNWNGSIYKCINCNSIPLASITNTGTNTNILSCKCPAGYGFYNNKCIPCSTINAVTGTSGVLTTIDGCVCPTGSGFDGNQCQQCPPGANNIVTSISALYNGCYCPTGSGLHLTPNGYTCITCPLGSSPTGTGAPVNDAVGCYCNNTTYSLSRDNTGNYYCIPPCPTGTSINGQGGQANTTGCFCSSGVSYGWNGNGCVQCMTNAIGGTTGTSTNITGCYCLNGYTWNGTNCVLCPSGTTSTNTGITSGLVGCNCNAGYQWSTALNECISCPTGTSTTGSGGTGPTGCFCSSGINYGWNNNSCIKCMPNAIGRGNTGALTNMIGCYCTTGYGWDGKQCISCPKGSTNLNTGVTTPLVGCYCQPGYQYNPILNICTLCPQGTNALWSGAPINVTGCNCPANYGWNGSTCTQCIVGASNVVTPQPTNITGCYCDSQYGWNGSTCSACPTGAVTLTPAQIAVINKTTQVTPVSGCYCPTGLVWSSLLSACISCPAGASPSGSGGGAAAGCFCTGGYGWNGFSCITCPLNAINTNTNIPTNVIGCYCKTGTQFSLSANACVCASGTTSTNTGITTPVPNCYCNAGYQWSSKVNACVQCPNGTNTTNTGSLISTGCYCPPGQGWNGSSCVNCPNGTSNTVTSTASQSNITGCYCPSGQGWNGSACTGSCPAGQGWYWAVNNCTPCWGGAGSNETGPPVIPGCNCPVGKGWNGYTCMSCPTGATFGSNGIQVPGSTGCVCISGYGLNLASDYPECVQCPPHSSVLPPGTSPGSRLPTSLISSGCYCEQGLGYDYTTAACLSCPVGTSTKYAGGQSSTVGCFCPVGYLWSPVLNSCVNCPRNTNVTGAYQAVTGCYCPTGWGWGGKICGPCPPGATNTNTGITTMLLGCYCPTGWAMSGIECINMNCPAGLTNINQRGTLAKTNVTGCFCPTYGYGWNGSTCVQCPEGLYVNNTPKNDLVNSATAGCYCPLGSSPVNTGGAQAATGCYCPNNYGFDGMQCVPCASGSFNRGGGAMANVPGCYCPNGYGWNGLACYMCPGGTTNTANQGSHTGGCYCPPGQHWNQLTNSCISCPFNTNPTNKGQQVTPGCNCPANSVWTGNLCMGCPQGASTTVTSNTTSITGCYCPTGYAWNDVVEECLSISCTGQLMAIPNGNMTPVTGCYCSTGYNWNGKACVCNDGTSATYTGQQIPRSYCFCPSGLYYNTGLKKCSYNAYRVRVSRWYMMGGDPRGTWMQNKMLPRMIVQYDPVALNSPQPYDYPPDPDMGIGYGYGLYNIYGIQVSQPNNPYIEFNWDLLPCNNVSTNCPFIPAYGANNLANQTPTMTYYPLMPGPLSTNNLMSYPLQSKNLMPNYYSGAAVWINKVTLPIRKIIPQLPFEITFTVQATGGTTTQGSFVVSHVPMTEIVLNVLLAEATYACPKTTTIAPGGMKTEVDGCYCIYQQVWEKKSKQCMYNVFTTAVPVSAMYKNAYLQEQNMINPVCGLQYKPGPQPKVAWPPASNSMGWFSGLYSVTSFNMTQSGNNSIFFLDMPGFHQLFVSHDQSKFIAYPMPMNPVPNTNVIIGYLSGGTIPPGYGGDRYWLNRLVVYIMKAVPDQIIQFNVIANNVAGFFRVMAPMEYFILNIDFLQPDNVPHPINWMSVFLNYILPIGSAIISIIVDLIPGFGEMVSALIDSAMLYLRGAITGALDLGLTSTEIPTAVLEDILLTENDLLRIEEEIGTSINANNLVAEDTLPYLSEASSVVSVINNADGSVQFIRTPIGSIASRDPPVNSLLVSRTGSIIPNTVDPETGAIVNIPSSILPNGTAAGGLDSSGNLTLIPNSAAATDSSSIIPSAEGSTLLENGSTFVDPRLPQVQFDLSLNQTYNYSLPDTIADQTLDPRSLQFISQPIELFHDIGSVDIVNYTNHYLTEFAAADISNTPGALNAVAEPTLVESLSPADIVALQEKYQQLISQGGLGPNVVRAMELRLQELAAGNITSAQNLVAAYDALQAGTNESSVISILGSSSANSMAGLGFDNSFSALQSSLARLEQIASTPTPLTSSILDDLSARINVETAMASSNTNSTTAVNNVWQSVTNAPITNANDIANYGLGDGTTALNRATQSSGVITTPGGTPVPTGWAAWWWEENGVLADNVPDIISGIQAPVSNVPWWQAAGIDPNIVAPGITTGIVDTGATALGEPVINSGLITDIAANVNSDVPSNLASVASDFNRVVTPRSTSITQVTDGGSVISNPLISPSTPLGSLLSAEPASLSFNTVNNIISWLTAGYSIKNIYDSIKMMAEHGFSYETFLSLLASVCGDVAMFSVFGQKLSLIVTALATADLALDPGNPNNIMNPNAGYFTTPTTTMLAPPPVGYQTGV